MALAKTTGGLGSVARANGGATRGRENRGGDRLHVMGLSVEKTSFQKRKASFEWFFFSNLAKV